MPKPISPPPRLEVLQETPQEGLHRTSTFRTHLEQAVDDINNKYSTFRHIKATTIGNEAKTDMAVNEIQGHPLATNNVSHYGQSQGTDADVEMAGTPSSIAVEAPPNSEADISVHTNPFTSSTLEEAAQDQNHDIEQPDNPFLDPMSATQLREEMMSPVEIPESSYDGHDWPQVESLNEMHDIGKVYPGANVALTSITRPPCLADELAVAYGHHGSKPAQPRNSSAPSVKALVDRYRGIEQLRVYPRPSGTVRPPDAAEKIIKSYRRNFSSETETSSDLSWEDGKGQQKLVTRAISGNPVVTCAGGWHADF